MRLFGGSGLVKATFFVACVATVLVIVMASDEVEKSIDQPAPAQESSLQPHSRQKRTIGHIFDMFKKMMDGLFGGGKKGGGKGKGRGRRPGAPPGGGYGAPQRPQRPANPGYGAPPRPRPPPRNPGLSGGYAGGAAPPRPASNGYGGPQQPPQQNFGGGGGSFGAGDSYGSPQAAPVGNQDSYGSPQAAPIGGNQDSYGSPQAAPIGNQDSYGSPQAAPVGPSNSYTSGGNSGSAPRRPSSSSDFGPSSVFYMIPAPNLATEAPQGQAAAAGGGYNSPSFNSGANAPDSYGSPQAAPIGNSGRGNQNQDSYGSPQSAPLSGGSNIRGNSNSYGSPVSAPLSPQTNSISNPVSNNYGGPQQVNSAAPAPSSYGSAPVSNNPFIRQPAQSSYGNNAAPLPITNNDLSGNFVPIENEDSYGSPGAGVAPAPITDIDLPDNTPIIIAGRAPSSNSNLDLYGSVAPVGTSAPVPEEVILEEKQPDSFDSYNNNPDEDVEEAPEGAVTSTRVEEEGEASPLFEDLRNVAFTSADDQTSTEAYSDEFADARDPIEINLSDGVVDLTNGLDQSGSGPGEVDLTNYSEAQEQNQETSPIPLLGIEDEYEYEYIGDENIPPELPDDLDLRAQDQLANQLEAEADPVDDENQESYGKPEATYDTDTESEYEYYYDYDEDYEYDPEQLPDTYGTTVSPLRSSTANFISVPLMIEEVTKDDNSAPVILAGTTAASTALSDDNQLSSYGGNRNTKRRAPHAFHQFLVEPPTPAKRQIQSSDWSHRIHTRRNRVWRQFNLD